MVLKLFSSTIMISHYPMLNIKKMSLKKIFV